MPQGAIDLTLERRWTVAMLVVFLAIAALAGADLTADVREGTTLGHVAVEGTLLLVGLAGVAVAGKKLLAIVRRARAAEHEAERLARRLEAASAEAQRWRTEARELVAGLGAAIDRQFERWGLTAAEKEVGLLLLKGWSHKEIAGARSVTEATARQQARSIYRKAGLEGRHDLAAFFLEGLMLPRGRAESA